ncbi:MAG TPA: DUF4199 domain-containing protein [Flavobacteriaceae bacterium]|nr:DUF4199 domain-containing protein [Flavobacteriaceae bacterium]|tara:strand:- start:304 stop:846 length:543 start_codon:yes stop_codon:yes gene_type:complete
MDESQKLVRKSSINYGLITGGVLALTTTLMYVLNTELFTVWWIGILTILFVIIMGIIATAKSKSLLGGIMTFRQAFSAYFITVAVALFISTALGILLFTIIDPELADFLNEKIIEITRDFMERFGAPESEIDKALAELEGKNNFSAGNQLWSYIKGLIFQAVLGLLVALIFKKKDPNAIN